MVKAPAKAKAGSKAAKGTKVAKGSKGTKGTKGKAAKGKAAKGAKPPKVEGLSPNAVKVLQALAKGKELTRVQLRDATGIAGGWAKLLGAATKDDYGVQGGGLAGAGLITINRYEGSRQLHMAITAKGRKALAGAK